MEMIGLSYKTVYHVYEVGFQEIYLGYARSAENVELMSRIT